MLLFLPILNKESREYRCNKNKQCRINETSVRLLAWDISRVILKLFSNINILYIVIKFPYMVRSFRNCLRPVLNDSPAFRCLLERKMSTTTQVCDITLSVFSNTLSRHIRKIRKILSTSWSHQQGHQCVWFPRPSVKRVSECTSEFENVGTQLSPNMDWVDRHTQIGHSETWCSKCQMVSNTFEHLPSFRCSAPEPPEPLGPGIGLLAVKNKFIHKDFFVTIN